MGAVSSQNHRGRPAERRLDPPYFPDKWHGACADFMQSVVRESGPASRGPSGHGELLPQVLGRHQVQQE